VRKLRVGRAAPGPSASRPPSAGERGISFHFRREALSADGRVRSHFARRASRRGGRSTDPRGTWRVSAFHAPRRRVTFRPPEAEDRTPPGVPRIAIIGFIERPNWGSGEQPPRRGMPRVDLDGAGRFAFGTVVNSKRVRSGKRMRGPGPVGPSPESTSVEDFPHGTAHRLARRPGRPGPIRELRPRSRRV